MIDINDNEMSLRKQCRLLSFSRSSLYYMHRPMKNKTQEMMKLVYDLFDNRSTRGSRKIQAQIIRAGHTISRWRVKKYMHMQGLKAIYPKPNLSQPRKEHKKYPYLLRGVKAEYPNHIWSADITYIPMATGRIYFVGIIDWATRKLLTWRISNTLDSSFCVEALKDALELYGHPKIFNTDQGSQFTSEAFTSVLSEAKISISMDGKGRFLDNIFIERFFRTLKYEEVFIRFYENVFDAKNQIAKFINFYNRQRLHQSLGYQTPDEVYYQKQKWQAA